MLRPVSAFYIHRSGGGAKEKDKEIFTNATHPLAGNAVGLFNHIIRLIYLLNFFQVFSPVWIWFTLCNRRDDAYSSSTFLNISNLHDNICTYVIIEVVWFLS